MSILVGALQGQVVRTIWRGPAVELIALGKEDAFGYFFEEQFEVHIPGEAVLYRSKSRSATVNYLEMLLGVPCLQPEE